MKVSPSLSIRRLGEYSYMSQTAVSISAARKAKWNMIFLVNLQLLH